MNLISIRIITDDVDTSAAFYEHLTGVRAVRPTPQFAEIHTPSATLAIGHTATVALFGPGSARPADNHTAIIEFLVDDVDAEYVRLTSDGSHDGDPHDVAVAVEVVQRPTTMPWGNRSLLLRDPDGTLVNLFTPATPAAIDKFGDVPR